MAEKIGALQTGRAPDPGKQGVPPIISEQRERPGSKRQRSKNMTGFMICAGILLVIEAGAAICYNS